MAMARMNLGVSKTTRADSQRPEKIIDPSIPIVILPTLIHSFLRISGVLKVAMARINFGVSKTTRADSQRPD